MSYLNDFYEKYYVNNRQKIRFYMTISAFIVRKEDVQMKENARKNTIIVYVLFFRIINVGMFNFVK